MTKLETSPSSRENLRTDKFMWSYNDIVLRPSEYSIDEHNHRLAAWDASTAARASSLCRFKVQTGAKILESSGFNPSFSCPSQLPSPERIDEKHKRWREAVILSSRKQGLAMSHGVAAKLINCYLKARFVCGGGHHDHPNVKCLHPPIDALLLNALAKTDAGKKGKLWRQFHEARWSKFISSTYQKVINLVRESLPVGEPLWKIEAYWRGYP